MIFENELIPGVLIKRYKRFFVDIKLKNKIITAHCPNPGSMIKLLDKGNQVWITKSNNDKRKLQYTLQIIEVDKIKFCVNTHITNKIIQEALEKKLINNFRDYDLIRPVKSVSLMRKKGHAEFPDSVTTRGKKHLESLMIAHKQGYESHLIFLIQIEKCKSFGIASDIDPGYYDLLKIALKKNVKVLCYDCKFSNKGIEINKEINL